MKKFLKVALMIVVAVFVLSGWGVVFYQHMTYVQIESIDDVADGSYEITHNFMALEILVLQTGLDKDNLQFVRIESSRQCRNCNRTTVKILSKDGENCYCTTAKQSKESKHRIHVDNFG